ADPIEPKGGVAHFVEQVQIFNRRVKDAEGGTNAGFARSARQLAQEAVAKIRRVRDTDARAEIVVACRCERARNAGIAGNNPTCGSGGKLSRLQPRDDGLDFALRVVPRHADFPAQPGVDREVRLGLVRVLYVKPTVARPGIQKLLAALVVIDRSTDQEIREIDSGFAAVEGKISIRSARVPLVDLEVAKFTAELHRVG